MERTCANDALETDIHKLFDRMARAMERGTGIRLSADEVVTLSVSSVGGPIQATDQSGEHKGTDNAK